MGLPMQAIYVGIFGIALVVTGCVAAGPGTGPAAGDAAALATGPAAGSAGAPAPLTLPSALAPTCSTDADCRLVPDYCAECACVSLPGQQKMPECQGVEVTCILNPCADHVAMCVNGRCSAESGSFR